jgi:transcriptional regulator GlxA family with amidase domain
MVPKRIGFVGFEGVTASHLAGPADVFSTAKLDSGYGNRLACYEICTIGLSPEPFQAESGMLFKPEATIQTTLELDTIVVPGGKGLQRAEVSEKIADWILARASHTRRVASVGTGIYGLAPTGLLDGREVTTHWRFASDVARRFPTLRLDHKRPLVKDGPFYTSSTAVAAIDLSLVLIEEDYGRHVALAVAQELVMPLTRRNGQQDLPKPLTCNSQPTDRFADLLPWIVRNLHEDLSVKNLAQRASMSPGNFNRAFKSVFGTPPAEFVENLRLNEAKRRLSVPKRTLETIAVSVGFSDALAFRRAFKRRFGANPCRYLNKFDSNSTPHPANGNAGTASPTEECLANENR